jgi:acyl carrier protein
MPEELTQRVLGTIAQAQRIPQEKVTIESTFEELGIDSMDGVNILFALENEFDITIPDEAAKQILNVRQMVDGVKRIIAEKAAEKAAEKTAGVPLP